MAPRFPLAHRLRARTAGVGLSTAVVIALSPCAVSVSLSVALLLPGSGRSRHPAGGRTRLPVPDQRRERRGGNQAAPHLDDASNS